MADGAGFIVLWSPVLVEGHPDQGGITAVRPGQAPHRYRPDTSAQRVTSIAVRDGFLACWDSQCGGNEALCGWGCLLLDPDLAVRRDWRPDFGRVNRLMRVGKTLYALLSPAEELTLDWSALDEEGERTGAPSSPPCSDPWAWSRPGWMASSALGVACLFRSDQGCGRQFNEPSDCTYGLELHGTDGAIRFSRAGIAPFGVYGSVNPASVAARDDGLLVGWSDRDGTWHGVPFSPDGTPGTSLDVAAIHAAQIHEVSSGYLVTWQAGVDGARPYRWVMQMVVSPSGTLARQGEPVETPRDDLPFQYADTVVTGTSGDRVAIAWEANQDAVFYPGALLYRSLGCLGEAR